MDMVGSSSVEFSKKNGWFYSTFRTIENEPKPDSTKQNLLERNKTLLRFCLVLVRTLRTCSWFCIVLAGILVVLTELFVAFWNGSGTGIVLLIFLNAVWFSPNILCSLEQRVVTKPEHSDTVSKVAPYYHMGKFVRYIEV